MKSLYEIHNRLIEAMHLAEEQAEANEGELSEELAVILEGLEMERFEKIGNICRYIKTLKAEADMVKAEADALAARVKSAKSKADSLKAYLASFVAEGETYADENSKVAWRKSEGVSIIDALAIPDEYCKIERKPVATDIKKALKAGIEIVGAEMYSRQNIQIK